MFFHSMSCKVVVCGGLCAIGIGAVTAHPTKENKSKLSDWLKEIQVINVTSSQSLNAAGLHIVDFPGQRSFRSYVPQISGAHVMNGMKILLNS